MSNLRDFSISFTDTWHEFKKSICIGRAIRNFYFCERGGERRCIVGLYQGILESYNYIIPVLKVFLEYPAQYTIGPLESPMNTF